MAFTTPGTAVAGEVLTAAFWNEQVRDNLTQLGTGYTFVETVYFTSGGTFTKATYPYLRAIRVKVQAGGAAGGGSSVDTRGGGGGGAGGYTESFITDIAGLSSSETVTVGAGGTGVSAAAGNAGGNSSFGSLVTANGGSGGELGATNQGIGGDGGVASTAVGDLKVVGGDGISTPNYSASVGATGGASVFGTGGRGSRGGAGGSAGTAGKAFGSGGSGGMRNGGINQPGSAGAPGIIIVELYA